MKAIRPRRVALAFGLGFLAFVGTGLGREAVAQDTAVQGRTNPGKAASISARRERRAILVRGADPVKGLPFFPPNALRALFGVYSATEDAYPVAEDRHGADAAEGDEVPVWYTRESLVLAYSWKKADSWRSGALVLARPQGQVIVLAGERNYLFFELSSSASEDPAMRAFVLAFDRKFQAFFENAATDAELSFPAYVDY